MKLLFVSTDNDRAGGAAYALSLAQAMAGAGHRVEVLAARHTYIARELQATATAWHHARFRNVLTPSANRTLASTIRHMRPDWLINGSSGKEYWPLIIHGRAHGIPVALFRHSARPMKWHSGHFLPRLAQRFIVSSDVTRALYIARGVPAERVQTLHNGVDTTRYRPDPDRSRKLRCELGIPADAIVVGNVGRTYSAKGIHCLQQALEQAMDVEPRLHALWLGDGPDLHNLRQAIAVGSHTHRHHLTGWLADTWPYYGVMSMLALASVKQETFGQVSIEAQASGVPVLGSRIGGIPETLCEGETGLLLQPGDVDVWRDGILALCKDEERQRMGKGARLFVEEHFSLPVTARSFTRLLTKLPDK